MDVRVISSNSKLDFQSEVKSYLERGYEIAGFNTEYREGKGVNSELFRALMVHY